MKFLRDPHLGELADSLYAEALTPWPLPRDLEIVTDDLSWQRLSSREDVVLYEQPESGPIVLHSGPHRWRMNDDNGWWMLKPEAKAGRKAAEAFEAWLTREHTPKGVHRGLCPASLTRVLPSPAGRR